MDTTSPELALPLGALELLTETQQKIQNVEKLLSTMDVETLRSLARATGPRQWQWLRQATVQEMQQRYLRNVEVRSVAH